MAIRAPRTYALLCATLGRDLGRLAYDYFAVQGLPMNLARAGNYEALDRPMRKSHINKLLATACELGDTWLVTYAIARGAKDWDNAIYRAYDHNQFAMADIMFARGAAPNRALQHACSLGSNALVDHAIAHGAIEWDSGLESACGNNHIGLARRMAALGATRCYYCGKQPMSH